MTVRGLFRTLGRALWWVFLKIEEPRVIRLVQFGVYVTMTVLGAAFLADLPTLYEGVLGPVLTISFGVAITAGGLVGALAVLPGTWWAERLGIILLWIGLGIYIVVALNLGASTVSIAVAVCLVLALLNRWLSVRKYQLAPGR